MALNCDKMNRSASSRERLSGNGKGMQDKSRIHFVLVAGFSSDNQEILGLKYILDNQGYSATAVSFYGPGIITDFTDLDERACIDNLARVINAAAAENDVVYGIGISLGGALLLEHAKCHDTLSGIVSIGTPFRLKNQGAIAFGKKVLPFVYPVWKRLQCIERLRLNPLGAAEAMIGFMEGTFLKDLERVTTPVLFLHSRKDRVTDYRALEEYLPKISSTRKHRIFFENGNHVFEYNPLTAEWALQFFGLIDLKELPGDIFGLIGNPDRALSFERME